MAQSIKDWAVLSRIKFTPVALFPFAAGVAIAAKAGEINWLTSVMGFVAVLFIMVVCHLLGEVFDHKEDSLTVEYGRTAFSGGTLKVIDGTFSRKKVITVAISLMLVAGSLGTIISLIQSNLLLFGLGSFGAASAVLYSTPPVRLVNRGVGEILIAVCFGWLTIATGYACAKGTLPAHSFMISIPLSLSIFNVILINQFPDYKPDCDSGKKNLVVRTGRAFSAFVYSISSLGVAITTLALWYFFQSHEPLLLIACAPPVLLSLFLGYRIGVLKHWKKIETLEPVCGLGIILHLLVAIAVAIIVTL